MYYGPAVLLRTRRYDEIFSLMFLWVLMMMMMMMTNVQCLLNKHLKSFENVMFRKDRFLSIILMSASYAKKRYTEGKL